MLDPFSIDANTVFAANRLLRSRTKFETKRLAVGSLALPFIANENLLKLNSRTTCESFGCTFCDQVEATNDISQS